MASSTEKRLEKVRQLADMFERSRKSGLSPTKFCEREGIHTSKFYYWKARFQEEGTNGLVDKRQGVAYKVTEEVRAYIRDVKLKDRMKSGSDISRMIGRKFGKTVSVFHVQRILKELGLNDPRGRKPGKTFKREHGEKNDTSRT